MYVTSGISLAGDGAPDNITYAEDKRARFLGYLYGSESIGCLPALRNGNYNASSLSITGLEYLNSDAYSTTTGIRHMS